MAREPISETELAYYIDNQLAPARQIEVEAYLAQEPALAARIMEELKIIHALRMAATDADGTPDPATTSLALRLQRAMARRMVLNKLRPALAACFLLAAGAVGGAAMTAAVFKPDRPGYLEAALEAHAVSQVRAVMVSQLEAPEYDRDELLSATAIIMPTLPDDWVVTDVQVYPSRFGPSVEMAIDAGGLGRASIFAARPGDFVTIEPTTAPNGDATLAHWQIDEVAYVLVSKAEPDAILAAANGLAATLD
ncbi:hypothetical protein ASG47_03385 [Devosia sp. Leaf420]|uniref:anti-sigma factor family protein n=1 Tax=Devosia sp. Leaf420 TaxID=1736374 RepID=UPI0007154729|nr:hypothetical protein [Devosia sp. Leaf420]KQT49391.1 hypothetical protein ASG47_03385 [Devosia sp. Leaf420]